LHWSGAHSSALVHALQLESHTAIKTYSENSHFTSVWNDAGKSGDLEITMFKISFMTYKLDLNRYTNSDLSF